LKIIGAIAVAILLAASCAPPPREFDRAYQGGLARVTHLSIHTLPAGRSGSSAVAFLRGTLPDACTKIDRVHQSPLGSHIELEVTTRRPFGSLCVRQAVPSERSVMLSLIRLWPGGLYTADANGVRAVFTVPLDPLD